MSGYFLVAHVVFQDLEEGLRFSYKFAWQRLEIVRSHGSDGKWKWWQKPKIWWHQSFTTLPIILCHFKTSDDFFYIIILNRLNSFLIEKFHWERSLNPEILKQTTCWWIFWSNNFVLLFFSLWMILSTWKIQQKTCLNVGSLEDIRSVHGEKVTQKKSGSTTSNKIQHFGRRKGWRRFLPPHSPSSNRRLLTVLEWC